MSTTARVGSAVAAGYLLGRFKKLRLALIVGSALANKDVRSSGMGLLQRSGVGGIGGGLTQTVKSELMQAGRAAAVSVAASKINRLSDRLQERSENMRSSAGRGASRSVDEDVDEEEDLEEEEPEDEYEEESEEEPEEEPEDEYEESEEEPEDEYEEEPDEEPEPEEHSHRSPRRRRTAAPAGSGGA